MLFRSSTIHVIDHLRRGQGSVTDALLVAGNGALVLQVVIITLIFTRNRWAPLVATIGGLGLAVGFTAAHWLPHWSELSDSFVDQPTAVFSYVASSLEILGGLAVGFAGLALLRGRGPGAVPAG